MKNIWKIWLRLNWLTKDIENDYVAEVSTVGNTKRNEDIARQIVADRTEYKYETILNILKMRDTTVCEMLAQGSSVQTGVERISPRILGNWIGAAAKFDGKVHKLTFDMTPSAELRAVLKDTGVEVLGVKDSGAVIGTVTDGATGATDGSITAGDYIVIEGEKIRVTDEEGCGVFLVNDAGAATKITDRMLQNDPKKVVARIPAGLEKGTYTLQIVTRFSNTSTVLKEPRTIVYWQPLIN